MKFLYYTVTIGTLLKFFIFWTFLSWLISYITLDSTDKDILHKSDLKLHIDNETGCHYLSTRKGHIIPRLDKDGKQVCSGFNAGRSDSADPKQQKHK